MCYEGASVCFPKIWAWGARYKTIQNTCLLKGNRCSCQMAQTADTSWKIHPSVHLIINGGGDGGKRLGPIVRVSFRTNVHDERVCECVSSTASRSRWSRGGRRRTVEWDRVPACGPASSCSDEHTGPEERRTETPCQESRAPQASRRGSHTSLQPRSNTGHGTNGHLLTVRVTEASSRITEYTRPLLFIVTYNPNMTSINMF